MQPMLNVLHIQENKVVFISPIDHQKRELFRELMMSELMN
jgi:hypothetical protein